MNPSLNTKQQININDLCSMIMCPTNMLDNLLLLHTYKWHITLFLNNYFTHASRWSSDGDPNLITVSSSNN
jgi:hypothetical protein